MPKIKAVLVGEAGVGKTCIAERITKDEFTQNSYATVGAANFTVPISIDNKNVTFTIWDTAGQEKYRSLTPMYFSGAQVAILVFDITSKNSFIGLESFYELLEQRAPSNCIFVLIGNKIDLENQRQVTKDEANIFSTKIGALFYLEVSAFSGQNIKNIFIDIVKSNLINIEEEEDDYIHEISNSNTKTSKKSCC